MTFSQRVFSGKALNQRKSAMSEFQAIPTEYKGVRFRSKSEAIFARTLDLATEKTVGKYLWEYEPERFAIGDYVPDFYVVHQRASDNKIKTYIVEYKPSRPTETYMEAWSGKVEELPLRACPVLMWGSPYKGGYQLFAPADNDGGWQVFDGWIASVERFSKEASKYRFDLKHVAA